MLDLAEIPTFQLLQEWKLEAESPREELERKAAEQAREWSRNLVVRVAGRAVEPHVERTRFVIDKGAGQLGHSRHVPVRIEVMAVFVQDRRLEQPALPAGRMIVGGAKLPGRVARAAASSPSKSAGSAARGRS